MSKRKEDMGRGIRALLRNIDEDAEEPVGFSTGDADLNSVSRVPLTQIEVNPFQPRAEFNEAALQELSDSIRVHGVIQPVTLRKSGPGKYQLIAGERRLRASKMAGLKDIPAYIRTANDQEALEIALIENIQREDLNAMEIAINYQRLIDECRLTHDHLGSRLGKNRSTVTNYLRLLKLPPQIQDALKKDEISMGHARALISIPEVDKQLYAYKEIKNKGLSVRKTEDLVRQINKRGMRSATGKTNTDLSPVLKRIEHRLMDYLETRVKIRKGKKEGGEIVIPYYSDSDLERLIELIYEE